MSATKHNQKKVDLTYLPEVAVLEECKAWMFGAKKYDKDNWKKLWGDKSIDVAMASLLRHAMAITSGELFDPESKLPHAAHIRCCAAMVLEHMANEKMIEPKVFKTRQVKRYLVTYQVEERIPGGYIETNKQRWIRKSDLPIYEVISGFKILQEEVIDEQTSR